MTPALHQAGRELHRYFADKRLGSFHFFRFLAENKQAGVWVSLCHVHNNPKFNLLASCTLDAGTRKLCLDNPSRGFNNMMGLTFLGKMFKSFGETDMIESILVSPAAGAVCTHSHPASVVYVSNTWEAIQSQQEVTLRPAPAAKRREAMSKEAKEMLAGMKALPKPDGSGKAAKKLQRGVVVRLPRPTALASSEGLGDDAFSYEYFSDDGPAVAVENAHQSSEGEDVDDVDAIPPPPAPFAAADDLGGGSGAGLVSFDRLPRHSVRMRVRSKNNQISNVLLFQTTRADKSRRECFCTGRACFTMDSRFALACLDCLI